MISTFKIITDISHVNIDDWRNLAKNNIYTTPFQSSDFFVFFNQIQSYRANIYAIYKDNKIESLCIVTLQKEKGLKGYFSRRAIIYGGPLLSDNAEESLLILLKAITKDLKRKVIYIETRNYSDYSKFNPIFLKQNWKYIPYLNVQLALKNKSLEEILAGMNYNRRRQIGFSLKEGAIYEEARKIKDVRDLYNILHELYLVRVKLPLPDFDYFEKLFLSPVGKVFIVKHNDIVIGGAFCIYSEKESIYSLYYCGMRDYHKKIFPTHLAILAAIEFGLKNNLKALDFMGAGKASEDYGVRTYKMEFGGSLIEPGRFIYICNPILFKLGKVGLNLLKMIKG